MYGERGDYDQAIAYIKQAFDSGKTVTTERVRLNALGYASLQLGNLYRHHGDFKSAIESYDEAIHLYDQMAFGAFSYVAHKGKFLACMAQGRACTSSEEELNTALRLFEEHRWKILETKNRYSFFDNEQNVYDVAIDYEFTTKDDKRKAFEYSERCRARSLLDLAEAGDPRHNHTLNADLQASVSVETAGLTQIQSEMTDKGQIVQYSVLADKVLIWFVSKEKFEGFEKPISSETLDEKVSDYLRLVASQSDKDQYERQRVSGELYDLLIKPVAHLLEGNKLVCFVPDKILNRLPFAALASPVDSSYLIEHYDLTFSPSSTMFIRRSKTQPERLKEGSEKLLIVGDPKFDLKQYPSYTYLPAADLEARQIANLYSSPEILTRAEATKSRVIDGMEKADVIHLATHAVVDEQSPMYSKLLLAKATDEPVGHQENDGVLLTSEIYNLRLRARLVVLPACRTGVEQYYGGEGMVGIWSPFITRNVPLVVASLWSVDSDSTKELMINFHKLRTQGHFSSAAALRKAQIAMLHGPDQSYQQPFHWAAFIAIGGYTTF
jgi:CHAT domain-containing protein